MRNNLLIFFGLLGLFSASFGQIQVSSSSLDFGEVNEITPKTIKVGLTNAYPDPVTLNFRIYSRFGRNAFTPNVPSLTLAGGTTDSVAITFAPMHNVQYNSEIMVVTNGTPDDFAIDVKGQGTYSKAYYSLTENSSEEDLKQSLQSLLTFGHQQMGYNAGRTHMFMVADNKAVNGQGASQNTIEGVYTGMQVVGYTSRTDAQNQGFNTEHTFPQSFFSSSEPMKSDLHHLFPTNGNANSQRANKPFGTVASPSWQVGGSKSNGSTFEPRDEHKGAAARAMIYFYLRYGDYAGFFASQENILVNWHTTFPPTAIHVKRNDDVETGQGNRNPLVDYPQFMERIHQLVGFSSAPTEHALDFSPSSMDFGTITWGPQAGGSASYNLVVINHGNILETLSDFRSNVPGITFSQPLGDSTLLPGEDLPIQITFSPSDSLPVNGYIAFNTTAPSMDSVVIPFSALINYVPSPFVVIPGTRTPPEPEIEIPDTLEGPVLFPNPTNESVSLFDKALEGNEATVLIYNLAGQKLIQTDHQFTDSKTEVSLAGLPESMYILEIRSGDYRQFFRLWVKY